MAVILPRSVQMCHQVRDCIRCPQPSDVIQLVNGVPRALKVYEVGVSITLTACGPMLIDCGPSEVRGSLLGHRKLPPIVCTELPPVPLCGDLKVRRRSRTRPVGHFRDSGALWKCDERATRPSPCILLSWSCVRSNCQHPAAEPGDDLCGRLHDRWHPPRQRATGQRACRPDSRGYHRICRSRARNI